MRIHVLGRVLRKRGIVRVSGKRNVVETENGIEKGIENANGTETETETDSRGEIA